MARVLYTRSLFNAWLALALIIPALVSAHLIEVPAGKKECFFEDLHIHDKVRANGLKNMCLYINWTIFIDDSHVPGRRRGALRH